MNAFKSTTLKAILLDTSTIERVSDFVNLGTSDGNSEVEVLARMGKAKVSKDQQGKDIQKQCHWSPSLWHSHEIKPTASSTSRMSKRNLPNLPASDHL